MNFLRRINNFLTDASAVFYLAVCLGYFFVRNFFMPLAYDDYAYAFVWDGGHGGNLDAMQDTETFLGRQKINSVADIFQSQYSHWLTWGGRVIGHGLAQFFIWHDKIFFDIANTVVLLILVLAVFELANLSWRKSKFALVWIFICLLFVGERFGETVIWMTWLTGACNYFWLTTLQLIFLLPYVKNFRGEQLSLAVKIFLPVLGVFAGWGTEAGSAATVFLATILILMAWRKKTFSTCQAIGFATLLTGFAANIFAPGNAEQLRFIQSVNPAAFSFTSELFLQHFLHGFLPVCAINLFVLLPVLIYFFREGFKREDILIVAFAAASFIVPLAMMFSPKFELRITVVAIIFALVAATMATAKLKNFSDRLKKFLPTVAASILLVYFSSTTCEFFFLQSQISRQEKFILQSRAEEVIKIPPLEPVPKIILLINGRETSLLKYFGGVTENPNYCLNLVIAQYYGAKKIIAVP